MQIHWKYNFKLSIAVFGPESFRNYARGSRVAIKYVRMYVLVDKQQFLRTIKLDSVLTYAIIFVNVQ
jgi:hypothetical protein